MKDKKCFSKELNEFEVKWGSIPEAKTLVAKSCTTIEPEWLKDLIVFQHFLIAMVILIVAPTICAYFCMFANYDFSWRSTIVGITDEEPCLVSKLQTLDEMARPPANCHSLCHNLKEIPVLDDISKEEFLSTYAYMGRPLLLKNATKRWTASKYFDYSFFQRLFSPLVDEFEESQNLTLEEEESRKHCQFFPYRSDFERLKEFFNMSETRSKLDPSEKSWYVGWSNCFPRAVATLREHYERPLFLPEDSEASVVDWIFMGGSSQSGGGGAPIHIDHVDRPSWQALVVGAKTWYLYPPPECDMVCPNEMKVNMAEGDILIVDTNLWYHATKVLQGIVTISIGSEYD